MLKFSKLRIIFKLNIKEFYADGWKHLSVIFQKG